MAARNLPGPAADKRRASACSSIAELCAHGTQCRACGEQLALMGGSCAAGFDRYWAEL
jgi:hypothetical protein